MSIRVDQRCPTIIELDCYNRVLELTDHVMKVCKPKDRNVNNKHIPKKNLSLGRMLMDATLEIGCDILEANMINVRANLPEEILMANYAERRRLQEHAIRQTYRVEHIFRVLHFDAPFAESTSRYMMKLLTETRDLVTKWRDSDVRRSKEGAR